MKPHFRHAARSRRRARPRMPSTPEEWQLAVDAAKGAQALESTRLYGLVTGGPTVGDRRARGGARGVEALKIGYSLPTTR